MLSFFFLLSIALTLGLPGKQRVNMVIFLLLLSTIFYYPTLIDNYQSCALEFQFKALSYKKQFLKTLPKPDYKKSASSLEY